MKVNVTIKNSSENAEVAVRKNGEVLTNIWGHGLRIISDESLAGTIRSLRAFGWTNLRKATSVWTDLRDKMDEATVSIPLPPGHPYAGYTGSGSIGDDVPETVAADTPVEPEKPKKDFLAIVKKWRSFMKDFDFTPQARFLNSLARLKKPADVTEYVIGYFSLTNNSFLKDVKEKVKSPEFKDMAAEIVDSTEKVINERLEVYYGEPGGGKTTTAIKDNPEAKVVICHAGMTPDELFRGFDFTADGKPTFKPCALKEAMLAGKPIILDEINLLNEDCRRTLQAVCDGKAEVTINDERIPIAKGFKIIGTMNLVVDEQVFGLPAPLVDRCAVIREFSMSDKMLAEVAF